MSDAKDWSPSYTAWKLFETVLAAEGKTVTDMRKMQILDLFSDCANAVSGEFVADIVDLDDEIEDDDFDDDDDDD